MKDPVRIGALVAAPILLALFVYFLFIDSPARYTAVGFMIAFAVLATRLRDLKNLNFGTTGIKAELEQKLAEAQATVTQLQRIAELFGKISVEQISMSNRMLGLSSEKKREFISNIDKELRAIGIPDERVKDAISSQRAFDTYDYYWWVSKAVPANPSQSELEAFTNFRQEFPHVDIGSTPSPSEVSAYLARCGITQGEGIERLKDWKHYEETGQHRRVKLWDARHDL
ncbi:hypothetical protein RWK44_16040 [Rhizobium sp. 25PS6]|uniref:hypothetical protein n=1 Tax=Rhizobium sp. 25PS6 TaxID=3075622 RepID=UPI0028FD6585|nr:hypothetical protein [Rhizobium sp. 25PS6]MDU0361914.1 hypothetical protein [Rhizobium sp. 25PS6]